MTEPRVRAVRPPAAAGIFYPSEPAELGRTVDRLLAEAGGPEDAGATPPFALVVPHAGYVYSGPVAATAYASLRPGLGSVERVAILGPAHVVPLRGAAVPRADAWATPLGEVGIDEVLRDRAVHAGAVADDVPHGPEHSLEVQLPFLQRLLGERLAILPVAVGICSPEEAADLIAAVAAEPGTLALVSTDLSHYHDHETARRLDRRTADAVLALDPTGIGDEDACGVFALRGVVELARREELGIELLDLRSSADTAADPWRVVGYGAFRVAART